MIIIALFVIKGGDFQPKEADFVNYNCFLGLYIVTCFCPSVGKYTAI
jgi:hypothetical protein